MHHFFAGADNISNKEIFITGSDYNHAVHVLRLKKGEKVMVSGPDACDYICSVEGPDEGGGERKLKLHIDEICRGNNELPAEIILFQCLPKSDRMELIVQKAVELGVKEIVPVVSKNCVVRLDEKKAVLRQQRWQAIAESAAKQSKRSIVPSVLRVMDLKEALNYCGTCDIRLIPYEHERGLTSTCEAIISLLPGRRIGVFIGPEGGFDPMEITMAKRHGLTPISLGSRVLRTETAAIAVLSLIMIRLEIAAYEFTDIS